MIYAYIYSRAVTFCEELIWLKKVISGRLKDNVLWFMFSCVPAMEPLYILQSALVLVSDI